MSRLLGIDLGERRIGLAVGDTASATTRALATIARGSPERDAETLGRIVADQRIDALVVGLPLLPGGSEGAQARATRAWVAAVVAGLGRPWSFQDERGTSLAAEAGLGRAPRGRSGGVPSPAARQRRRSLIDREAARRIVQAGMDAGLGVIVKSDEGRQMARPNAPSGTVSRLEVTDRDGPKGPSRGGRLLPWVAILGLAAIIIVGGLILARPVIASWALDIAEFNPQALNVPFVRDLVGEQLGARLTAPAGADGAPVAFEVKTGATADQVTADLETAGLLTDPFAFRYLAITGGQQSTIEAGTYELRKTMSPKDVLAALQSAQVVPVKVALREGLRIEQMTAYLETLPLPPTTAREFYDLAEAPTDALRSDYAFLRALPAGRSLEGFLGAGTFDVYPWASGEDIVRLLLKQWGDLTAAADPVGAAEKAGLDFYDVLTIASIVEREAGVDADRAKIAGVFWDRLKAKMAFESDVVVIYGADTVELSKIDFSAWQEYFFWGPLKTSYSSYKLPAALAGYQAYQHVGMIAGPIVTPTLKSIEAALQPDTKDGYLYFVLKNDGSRTMAFARTYAEHLRNVRKYMP